MIGERIRKARLELGMSQSQLAGKEMTRAFISLLETGRCNASPETLRIIARRLGKPISYFREEDPAEDQTCRTAEVVLRGADRALAENRIDDALLQARNGIELAQIADRPDLEARGYILEATCIRRQGDYHQAIESYEAALERYKMLKDPDGIAQSLFELGNCAVHAEEFLLAKRWYERALPYTEGRKRGQTLQARIRLYLGSVLYRIGRLPQAIESYRAVLTAAQKEAHPDLWAGAAMGLGWVYYCLQEIDKAMHYSRQAEAVFRRLNLPQLTEVRHNIAIFEAARQRWESAYVILQECLETYRNLGLVVKQASVLEDLADYWEYRGDLERARLALLEAIALLDVQDNGIQRGRTYRKLGNIEAKLDNTAWAQAYTQIGNEILRRLKTPEVSHQSVQDQSARKRQQG